VGTTKGKRGERGRSVKGSSGHLIPRGWRAKEEKGRRFRGGWKNREEKKRRRLLGGQKNQLVASPGKVGAGMRRGELPGKGA